MVYFFSNFFLTLLAEFIEDLRFVVEPATLSISRLALSRARNQKTLLNKN